MKIIGGADFFPTIDNYPIQNWKSILVKTGSVLRFKKLITGSRAYLAVKKSEKKLLGKTQQLPKLQKSK